MQYKIKKGDTLSAISRKLGISIKDLAAANKIKDVNKIQAGASLIIPQPKKKKSSSVERVKPQEKKETKPKKKTKKREPILPINVRQFLNPNQDRTEEDLSTEEKKALKEVIARSQTAERIAEKKAQGLDPNLIEYKDYATTSEGSQYADVDRTSDMSVGDLANKIQNPNYNLKTFLGQATAIPQEGGGYRVVDTFDFKPQTEATGLKKVKQYLGSIDDAGFNPYAQLRNFMGYYGPQEGTGQGGKSNINLSAQGGQTRYNFNKGGNMNIQQQTKNVAAQGRYGDSMLLHVNPAEVKGLAQAMPITVNPETGQPEAFLPFLAPLAGSLLGGSLLTGVGGLSSLAAGAIGSGVAQYAVTGDLKKGLLAGLTGYGVGSALQGAAGAAGAQAGTDVATSAVTTAGEMGTEAGINAINQATQQAGAEAAKTAASSTGVQNLQAAFGSPTVGASVVNPLAEQGFGQAVGANTFTNAGADAVGNQFGSGVGNLVEGLSQPGAYIPAGIGMGGTSIMESQELFAQQEADRLRRYNEDREEMYRNTPEPILYSAAGGIIGFDAGGQTGENYPIEDIYINDYSGGANYSDPMSRLNGAGGYARNSSSYTGGELPQIYAPDRAAYDVNPNYMAGFQPETMYFNPSTVSAPASNLTRGGPPSSVDTYEGSKGGYGGMQASIAPQTSIDPFAAYTGQAPAGLQFTDPTATKLPITPPVITPPPITPPPIIPPPIIPPITPPYDPPYDFPIEMSDDFAMNLSGIGDMDFSGIDFSQFNQQNLQNMLPGMEDMRDFGNTIYDSPINNMPIEPISTLPMMPPMTPPRDDFMSIDRMQNPNYNLRDIDFNERNFMDNIGIAPPIRGRAGGGGTLPNKGLEALAKTEKGKEAVEAMGFEGGGMTDPLIAEVTEFILGTSDNSDALNAFVEKYGNEAFMQLREQILQSLVPNAQTEGQIQGDGNGGMDDDLFGRIGNQERIAVSQDEFIVPADVVSMLGDGSSDAGSKELYAMMDRVRREKTGTTKQAPRLANAGGMLPA